MTHVAGLLRDRVVMITGASSGIGAAAARLFAAEGAAVVLMARRGDKLEEVAEEIRLTHGRATAVPGDVCAPRDVARAVTRAVEEFGGLDGAFNNAGYGLVGPVLHRLDEDVYDTMMNVNVRGVWNCMRQQIPAMLCEGRGGSIVNMSSVAGSVATRTVAPYVAAKHAVLGLTRAAAAEYGAQGIRVNALMAGTTRTELTEAYFVRDPGAEREMTRRAIQPRAAEPWEVAQAAVWLCSARASFVTGGAIPVDGGWSAV